MPIDGIVTPGNVPPPMTDPHSTTSPTLQRFCSPPQSGKWSKGHAPQRDGFLDVASQVGKGHVLQSFEHKPSGPEGPGQRMPAALLDELSVTGDHARLRAAEKLVTGEGHERRTRCEGLVGSRLPHQPRRGTTFEPRTSLVQQTRPEIHDDRGPEARQFGDGDRLR